jgi:hypothetical protein
MSLQVFDIINQLTMWLKIYCSSVLSEILREKLSEKNINQCEMLGKYTLFIGRSLLIVITLHIYTYFYIPFLSHGAFPNDLYISLQIVVITYLYTCPL